MTGSNSRYGGKHTELAPVTGLGSGAYDASHCWSLMVAGMACDVIAQAEPSGASNVSLTPGSAEVSQLPYGQGAALLHADGGSLGGGYEWSAASAASPLRRGHTAIELDRNGRISLVSVMYDSSVLSYPAYQSLVGLAAEAPLS